MDAEVEGSVDVFCVLSEAVENNVNLALDKTLVWLEKSLTKHAVEKRGLFHRPQRLKRVEVMVVSHVVCLDALAITRRILTFLSIIFLMVKARNHRS